MYLLLFFLIKYLQYESNTFLTFIKNDDLNKIKDPKQRYTFIESIGKGGFGEVSIYYDNTKNEEVVIKKITKIKKDEKEKEKFDREIIAMKDIICQNSVKYYDHFEDKDSYYIVMEKCDGDLKSFIEKNESLSDSMIKNILLQLNKAFKIMHSKNMIHRDLKPENILIKNISQNNFIFKLADFGLSRVFENNNFSTHEGSFGYMAPEQLDKKKYYEPTKCDLWAIGVIIYELKFNEVPVIAFYQGNIPEKFDNKFLDDLVRRLIVIDSNKRIDWNDYFNHPFFKN